jgi:Pentapeptide repeats (8 copies)
MAESTERAALVRRRGAMILGCGVAVAVVVAVVGWLLLKELPELLARDQSPGFGPQSEAKAISDARTSTLQLLGGLVLTAGVCFTAWTVQLTRKRDQEQRRANEERIRVDRDGQVTERFTRAVEQLGADKTDIRLGGIYALERIARESEVDHEPIVQILAAFLRQHANKGRPVPDTEDQHVTIEPSPADSLAALEALGRLGRQPPNAWVKAPLDLRRIRITGANLNDARLDGALLNGAILRSSQMDGASLTQAVLSDADLRNSDCEATDFHSAWLDDADLRDIKWAHATIDGAHLEGAKYQIRPDRGPGEVITIAEATGRGGLSRDQLDTAIEGD